MKKHGAVSCAKYIVEPQVFIPHCPGMAGGYLVETGADIVGVGLCAADPEDIAGWAVDCVLQPCGADRVGCIFSAYAALLCGGAFSLNDETRKVMKL
jgi:hypothetical protein